MSKVSTHFRRSMKLCAILLLTQCSALCLAHQNTASRDVSATAYARSPDPSMSTSVAASSTSSAPAQTHTIQVGLADHKFRPDVTMANVGDTVEFRFYPTNHSVVRAEYGFPCIPYEMTGTNKHGFFSGFNAVDKVVDDPPKYSIKINDTEPIFFYCSATGSCINYGMVGAINPNASTSITTQEELARKSAYMLNPGEPFPPEAPLPSSLPSSTAIPSSIATPSSTAIPVASAARRHGLSPGAIAGIVIAAFFVLCLCGGLFFCWGRTRTLKDEVERKESSIVQRVSRSDSAFVPGGTVSNTPTGLGIYGSTQHLTSPQAQLSPMHEHDVHRHYDPVPYRQNQFEYQQQHQHQHQDHKPLPLSPPLHHHPAFSLTSPTYILHTPHTAMPHELSPHSSSSTSSRTSDTKYGPYGLQQQRQSTASPAPPYGWHVNQLGPAEMEGTPGVEQIEGGRVRWEEVGANRAGEGGREGRMF